jgi:apolipoprotein N-acyltransferase
LAVAGHKAGISICYEDAFGEEVIRELPMATLLVNVSNDAWFGHSIAPQQHLEIARMRALETGRPLLRATNTGVTAIVDARARVQAVAPQFKVYALTGEVQPMQGLTPYARYGNYPVVSLSSLLFIAAGWRVRRKRR